MPSFRLAPTRRLTPTEDRTLTERMVPHPVVPARQRPAAAGPGCVQGGHRPRRYQGVGRGEPIGGGVQGGTSHVGADVGTEGGRRGGAGRRVHGGPGCRPPAARRSSGVRSASQRYRRRRPAPTTCSRPGHLHHAAPEPCRAGLGGSACWWRRRCWCRCRFPRYGYLGCRCCWADGGRDRPTGPARGHTDHPGPSPDPVRPGDAPAVHCHGGTGAGGGRPGNARRMGCQGCRVGGRAPRTGAQAPP